MMASGHASEDNPQLIFGYNVDSLYPPSAPDPPPGAPLLSDNEQQLLNSFFEGLNSNDPDYNGMTPGPTHSDGWMDLPPKFMGSTSYYGYQNDPRTQQLLPQDFPYLNNSLSAFSMPPPPPPLHPNMPSTAAATSAAAASASASAVVTAAASTSTQDQRHSADVLEAASVLQGGSLRQSLFETVAHQPSLLPANASPVSPMALLHAAGSMAYATPSPIAAASRPQQQLRWGSDQSFNQVQYTPLSDRETTEALEQERLKTLECFEVGSALPTRQSSPTTRLSHLDSATAAIAGVTGMSSSVRGTANVSLPSLPPPPPPPPSALRKRRKGHTAKEEADIQDNNVDISGPSGGPVDEGPDKLPRRKRSRVSGSQDEGTGSNDVFSLPLSPNSPQRTQAQTTQAQSQAQPQTLASLKNSARRGRGSQAQNKKRENLTEEQKRENHIKSEQKRRAFIKEGFDDLCALVPTLGGGGFSKSVMLSMTAEWLQGLMEGNEQLRQQLHGQ